MINKIMDKIELMYSKSASVYPVEKEVLKWATQWWPLHHHPRKTKLACGKSADFQIVLEAIM